MSTGRVAVRSSDWPVRTSSVTLKSVRSTVPDVMEPIASEG